MDSRKQSSGRPAAEASGRSSNDPYFVVADNNGRAGKGGRASKIVRLMREDILRRPDGEFIGGEADLLDRYQVSRQTLRSAARVLESEQMLRVRRGVGGGYYVRRPTAEVIGRTAATYLRIRQTTLDHVLEANSWMGPLLARKAAISADSDVRERLSQHLGALDHDSDPALAEFLAWDIQAAKLIAQLAGNPALELMVSVFGQIGIEESRIYADRPERVATWLHLRRKLISAILERDPEIAAIHASRGNDLFHTWRVDGGEPGSFG